ncbi:MAG: ferritin-like domain-containing protein [Dehalococcoidia bacterium]
MTDREGPITEEYRADVDDVCERLNRLRSTEIVSYLQYKQHGYMAVSLMGPSVAGEFVEHAGEEIEHADMLAERIQQLGGVPLFDPGEIASYAERMMGVSAEQGPTLEDMVREDLELERTQVRAYTSLIREIGDQDIVTRRLLEDILIATENHASEMRDLLAQTTETRPTVASDGSQASKPPPAGGPKRTGARRRAG